MLNRYIYFASILLFPAFNLLILLSLGFTLQDKSAVITDCNYTLEEALSGKDIPTSIKSKLIIVNVEYYSFDKQLHRGQLVINKYLKKDIVEIFNLIKEKKFPVSKVIPVTKYNWDDDQSMQDNNTSAFNYRKVQGTKILSAHSTGRGIDINPALNPQVTNGKTSPKGAVYNPRKEGTINAGTFIVKEFQKRGWKWGGTWINTKDYQHFEK